jgi:hypothetical protein
MLSHCCGADGPHAHPCDRAGRGTTQAHEYRCNIWVGPRVAAAAVVPSAPTSTVAASLGGRAGGRRLCPPTHHTTARVRPHARLSAEPHKHAPATHKESTCVEVPPPRKAHLRTGQTSASATVSATRACIACWATGMGEFLTPWYTLAGRTAGCCSQHADPLVVFLRARPRIGCNLVVHRRISGCGPAPQTCRVARR